MVPVRRRFVIAAAALGAVWLAIPYFLLPRHRAPLGSTPADVGLDFETVRIESGTPPVALVGWWIPAPEPRGVVLLLHDGSSNRSFVWSRSIGLARAFHERGYHVLAPDFRGHGEFGDPGFLPLGRNLAPDVGTWIDFAEPRAGRLPVMLHGFGLGGQVAIYAAAADPRVVAVIADSTWADLHSSLRVSLPSVTPIPGFLLPSLFWIAEHVYGVDFAQSRAVDVAGDVGERLLLIANEEDPQIPRRQLRWLAEAAQGSEVWVTPAPPPDHPIYAQRGSWGTHDSSYQLDPDGYAARVGTFIDTRVARATALAAAAEGTR